MTETKPTVSDWTAPPLALTMGDPAGVGPLIAAKAWRDRGKLSAPFAFIGSAATAEAALRSIGMDAPVRRLTEPTEALTCFQDAFPILATSDIQAIPGTPNASAATAIVDAIDKAVDLTLGGQCSAVVTNPINKALLYSAGFSFPGHTEYLAELARRHTGVEQAPRPVMMLTGGGLKVALATIHVALKDVPSLLNRDDLEEVCRIVMRSLDQDFGLNAPRLALAGLNPHAGEDGAIGQEEIEVINPVADMLMSEGLSVSRARPGDTVFHEMLDGAFDAIVAMYHDQGLAPLKTLDMWGGVNTTLGLPFIRTSPDHGTAYDAAKSGNARADSLIAALNQAADMAISRARHAS